MTFTIFFILCTSVGLMNAAPTAHDDSTHEQDLQSGDNKAIQKEIQELMTPESKKLSSQEGDRALAELQGLAKKLVRILPYIPMGQEASAEEIPAEIQGLLGLLLSRVIHKQEVPQGSDVQLQGWIPEKLLPYIPTEQQETPAEMQRFFGSILRNPIFYDQEKQDRSAQVQDWRKVLGIVKSVLPYIPTEQEITMEELPAEVQGWFKKFIRVAKKVLPFVPIEQEATQEELPAEVQGWFKKFIRVAKKVLPFVPTEQEATQEDVQGLVKALLPYIPREQEEIPSETQGLFGPIFHSPFLEKRDSDAQVQDWRDALRMVKTVLPYIPTEQEVTQEELPAEAQGWIKKFIKKVLPYIPVKQEVTQEEMPAEVQGWIKKFFRVAKRVLPFVPITQEATQEEIPVGQIYFPRMRARVPGQAAKA